MNNANLVQVAKIGRLVGLRGELKLNIHCDFPEQFHQGATFYTDKNFKLIIESYNQTKKTVLFKTFNNRDDSSKLVNVNLLVSKDDSQKECKLEVGEYFWFDMVGATLVENDKVLGRVDEIERIGANDYLIIKTIDELVDKNLPKLFYVPYIDRYIVDFDKDAKIIHSKDAFGILENS
jgi:16S rRNA processing protein RimM